MTGWHILLGGVALLAVAAALYGLDRLGLWLEDRGWLYYRRKKPASSPLGMWVGMQQLLEPGVKHVREVGPAAREEYRQARKQRLASGLLACLEADPVRPEQVRLYLAAAQEAGWDYEPFYAEAVRQHLAARPERAAGVPPLDDVRPD
jgi:hypothetical protein